MSFEIILSGLSSYAKIKKPKIKLEIIEDK